MSSRPHSAAPVPPEGRLYAASFHRDPDAAYRVLRACYGRAAPVEIQPGVRAYLLMDYDLVRDVVQGPALAGAFTRDTGRWSGWHAGVDVAAEVRAMVAPWPNMLFAEGPEHERLRTPAVRALARIDQRQLAAFTRRVAGELIDEFPASGADLVRDFAVALPVLATAHMFGITRHAAHRLPSVMRSIWDGNRAQEATDELVATLTATVHQHTARAPADRPDDLTTGLLAFGGLTLREVVGTMVLMVGAGCQPATNLIAGALATALTDARARAERASGRTDPRMLVDYTLVTNPPIAHYPPLVALRDVHVDQVTIPAGALVLLGLGPAARQTAEQQAPALYGNRSYLAFGVGAHACPAARHAHTIAAAAVQALHRRVTDLRLAPDARLRWRPSPFARGLAALPVTFTPIDSPAEGGTPWRTPAGLMTTRPAPTSTAARPPNSSPAARSRPSFFPRALRRGR